MNKIPATPEAMDLGKKLLELYSQPGISGTILQLGAGIIRHDLPISDRRVTEFASRLNHLLASYETVGRNVWQLCAGFKEYWLLILCRDDLRLGILVTPGSDTTAIASRTMNVLMQIEPLARRAAHSPGTGAASPAAGRNGTAARPPVERADLEARLAGLLGRVIGSAQASRLITREIAAYGVGERLTLEQARDIGHAVLEKIPNRGKRSALISEFDSSL
jgi:hypothetical protein